MERSTTSAVHQVRINSVIISLFCDVDLLTTATSLIFHACYMYVKLFVFNNNPLAQISKNVFYIFKYINN